MFDSLHDVTRIAIDFAQLPLRPDVFTIKPFEAFGITLGPFALRWYSLSYIAAIIGGWWLLAQMIKQPGSPMTATNVDDFITWATLGVILGGRLGYVIFYNPAQYLADPMAVFRVWDGGMSFHGGCFGVILGCWGFGLANKVSGLRVLDYVATVVAAGAGARAAGQFRQWRAMGPADGHRTGA